MYSPRNGAADDLRCEFETFATAARFQSQEHVAVLPVSAGLLLVLVFHVRHFGDGLLVADARRGQLQLDAELTLGALGHHVYVRISHAGDDELAGRVVTVQHERWVLFGEPRQR